MNWRRVLSFCSVLVLIVGLALPVSADGISYTFDIDFSSGNSFIVVDWPFSLDSVLTVDVYVLYSDSALFWMTDVGSFAWDPGEEMYFLDLGSDSGCFLIPIDGSFALGFGSDSEPDFDVSASTGVRLVVSMYTGSDSSSVFINVFNWVISWVGSIFSAITTGSLAGLGSIFAIGIAISGFFMALSAIFKFLRL